MPDEKLAPEENAALRVTARVTAVALLGAVATVSGLVYQRRQQLAERFARHRRGRLAGRELTVCAGCLKAKRAASDWERLDRYLHADLGMALSHGLCPVCAADILAELDDNSRKPADVRSGAAWTQGA